MSSTANKVYKSQSETRDPWFVWLVLLFIGVAGTNIILSEKPEEQASLSSKEENAFDVKRDRDLDLVDIHLKELDQKEKINEANRVVEAEKLKAIVDPNDPVYLNNHKKFDKSYGVDQVPEDYGKKVLEDIESSNSEKLEENYLTPEDRVNAHRSRQRFIYDHEQKNDEEYIKTFLANAEQAGYRVELNENLEVVSIKKILNREPLRFPQSVKPRGKAAH